MMKLESSFSKTTFCIVAAAMLLIACSKKIDYREAEIQRGLVYRAHENTPFTGIIKNEQWSTAFPTTAIGSCTVEFKDGLRDGKRVCTSTEGVKLEESEWKEGKRNGTEKRWESSTGKFWKLTHYVNDQKDGLEEIHNPFENEVLVASKNWVNGHKEGSEKAWDPTGQILRTDLVWSNGKKTGVSRFNEYISTYKNDVPDGVQTHYEYRKDQYMPKDLAKKVFDIQHTVEMLQGGSDFIGDLPGMIIQATDVLENGVHKVAPALQACVNAKIEAYKADPFSFQHGVMSNVDIIKWEDECSGKTQVVAQPSTSADLSACLNAKIAAARKSDPDGPISNDVLDEWEKGCKVAK